MPPADGWQEHQLLVLSTIQSLDKKTDKLVDSHNDLRAEVASLREASSTTQREVTDLRRSVVDVKEKNAGLSVKAGVWTLLAGAIPTAGAALYLLLR